MVKGFFGRIRRATATRTTEVRAPAGQRATPRPSPTPARRAAPLDSPSAAPPRDATRKRPPRYRLSLPAVVTLPSGSTFMTTFSVSRGGCGLAWIGPAPRLGDTYFVRLGAGRGAATLRAMVCWTRSSGRHLRVGVRFVGGQDSELQALIAGSPPDA